MRLNKPERPGWILCSEFVRGWNGVSIFEHPVGCTLRGEALADTRFETCFELSSRKKVEDLCQVAPPTRRTMRNISCLSPLMVGVALDTRLR